MEKLSAAGASMDTISIDGSSLEFGNSISCGILMPFFLKNSGKYKVRVYSKIDFPQSVWSQFCDEYIVSDEKRSEGTLSEKNDIEAFVFKEMEKKTVTFDHIKSIQIPYTSRSIREKYVVMVPVVYGWRDLTCFWRTNHALEFKYWKQLKKEINQKGYLAVGFGTDHSCSEEQLEELSDIFVWEDMDGKKIRPTNKMLFDQLQTMKYAKTSLTIAGASHVPMAFDVPGIGWDEQIPGKFGHFCDILSFKRTNLQYIPMMEYLGRDFGLQVGREMENHNEIQNLIYKILSFKINSLT